MSTCKDCVHYEVCGKGVDGAMDRDQLYFESCFPRREEFDCTNFKPKSRFVELPCEVGSTVYEVCPKIAFFMATNAIGSECEGYGISERVATLEDIARWITPSRNTGITYWGGTVFPTKEEAEKALAERSK